MLAVTPKIQGYLPAPEGTSSPRGYLGKMSLTKSIDSRRKLNDGKGPLDVHSPQGDTGRRLGATKGPLPSVTGPAESNEETADETLLKHADPSLAVSGMPSGLRSGALQVPSAPALKDKKQHINIS